MTNFSGTFTAKSLPHSLESERALLGALLLDSKCIVDVPESLVPTKAMYNPIHGIILQTIRVLDGKQATIDITTVSEQLVSDGMDSKLKPLGGLAYLGQLTSAVVTVENISYHAKAIAEYFRRRQVIELSTELNAAAERGGDAWEEPSWEILRDTIEANAAASNCANGRTLATELQAELEQRAADAQSGVMPGISSGLETLDDLIRTGWITGRDYLIAARPGDGKTSLVCQIAKNAAVRLKIPVLFFSVEMNRSSLVEKIAVDLANVNADSLARGVVSAEDWAALYTAISLISESPLWVADGSMTVADIRARALLWRRRLPLGPDGLPTKALIIIDFFQIIDHQQRKNEGSPQAMSRTSRIIKRLADEAKVAMVMVSAMTRDAEKESRRPRKSDLRECGALESDADAILFLHRPADSEYTEFILAKHRFGPAGLANMRFDGSRTRYLDVPYEEREVQPEEKTTRRKRNRGDKPAAPPPQSPPSFYEPELEGIR